MTFERHSSATLLEGPYETRLREVRGAFATMMVGGDKQSETP